MLQIRSDYVNKMAERLAGLKRLTKTDAVKLALENELRRIEEEKPLLERLSPIMDRIAARPATGLMADKAFYDDLSGEA